MWGDLGEKMIVLSAESDQHMKVASSFSLNLTTWHRFDPSVGLSLSGREKTSVFVCMYVRCLGKACIFQLFQDLELMARNLRLPCQMTDLRVLKRIIITIFSHCVTQEDHQKKAVLGIFGEEREVGKNLLHTNFFNRPLNSIFYASNVKT